ncbi:MAG TPA: lamin tail domain-containing protein [Dehalococcoidia bacterium]|nr:lamin tail domain-containing protein [Dehalococcoidia bacterium]
MRRAALGLFFITVILSVPQAATAQSADYDYVANGGFEAGIAGWTITGGQVDAVDASVVVPAEGAAAARMRPDGGAFNLRQTNWDGAPPGEYTVKASVYATAPAEVRLVVSADPGRHLLDVLLPPITNAWHEVETTLTLPGEHAVTMAVVGSAPAGTAVYVDAVRLLGPPPATPTSTRTHTPPPTDTPSVTRTPTRTPTPSRTPAASATVPREAAGYAPGFANGGFEEVADGVPERWEKYGGELAATSSRVRTGSMAARFASGTGSLKWMYQTVSVTGGDGYEFGAWIWHDDGGVASAYLRISWYASEDGSGEAITTADSTTTLEAPAAEWRHLTTGGVAAPAGARSAKLRIMFAPRGEAHAALSVDDATFGPATVAPSAPAASDPSASVAASGRSQAESGGSGGPRVVRGGEAPPAGTTSGSPIVINEVLYDPAQDGDDADNEWIELYNAGDAPVDLGGWTVADNRSSDRLPAFVLEPGGFVVVAARDAFLANYPQFDGDVIVLESNIGNQLGNDGDLVALIDPGGRFADAVSWGDDGAALSPPIEDAPEGHSLERRTAGVDTDRAADFLDNERPSPGEPYGAPGAEVTAGGDGPAVRVLPAAGESYSWVIPLAIGVSGTATLAALAWRFGPEIAARVRRQSW